MRAWEDDKKKKKKKSTEPKPKVKGTPPSDLGSEYFVPYMQRELKSGFRRSRSKDSAIKRTVKPVYKPRKGQPT